MDLALPARSGYLGKRIADITIPKGGIIVCIVRAGKPVVPAPETIVEPGDELVVYSQLLDIAAVGEALSKS